MKRLLAAALLASCATASADTPVTVESIVAEAYEAAGGEAWRRPQSLTMTG